VHLATEFVIDVSQEFTKATAYATAFAFPMATLVLLVLLMRAAFPLALKITIGLAALMYAYLYGSHLYLLYNASGWGRISGFILFGYGCIVLLSYYALFRRQRKIELWHASRGLEGSWL
jgi:1,4-dihydroxy-2-naphthoate octaprenyltransferase